MICVKNCMIEPKLDTASKLFLVNKNSNSEKCLFYFDIILLGIELM